LPRTTDRTPSPFEGSNEESNEVYAGRKVASKHCSHLRDFLGDLELAILRALGMSTFSLPPCSVFSPQTRQQRQGAAEDVFVSVLGKRVGLKAMKWNISSSERRRGLLLWSAAVAYQPTLSKLFSSFLKDPSIPYPENNRPFHR
jgi:hypothetical protein